MQPLASLKALGDPIYETFYGLSEQPFSITTDPKFFYLTGTHERAFSELSNGLRRREGMLLLTGDTGTGKTTLCRAVIESLGKRTFSALILNPYMNGAEVFRIVLRDFGLVTHDDLRRGTLATADVPQLLDTLEGFLRSLVPLDSHAVIVLDEAQSLAPQVLDQIRLLTALEQDNRRLVQIVLCGQPGLLDTLKQDSLQALNERITRRVALEPLTRDQVRAYVQHRLAIAGGSAAVSFDPGATRLVAELAHGLPRRVNVLCDRALQEGRIEGAHVITADLVKRAARALAGVHEPLPERLENADAAIETRPIEQPEIAADEPLESVPDRSRVNRRLLYGGAMAMAAMVAAAMYAVHARGVLAEGIQPPQPPAAPAKNVGDRPPDVVAPSDEDVQARGSELRFFPSAQQLPDDRNQLD